MAIDVRRAALAALEAAFDQQHPSPKRKHRLPAVPALLLGAGALTIGRIAFGEPARELVHRINGWLDELERAGPEEEEPEDYEEDELEDYEDEDEDEDLAEEEPDEPDRHNGARARG